MNDTLIALGAAGAALAPFAWLLRKRWQAIRPVQDGKVLWAIETNEGTDEFLRARYAVHGEWLSQEWEEQYRQKGREWLLRATPAQEAQLQEVGWGAALGKGTQLLTRSQAMDLLMLAQPADADDMEMLEFFNMAPEEPNALVVSYRAAALRGNPTATQSWYERVATPVQKEAIRYFEGKVPKTLTAEQAKATLGSLQEGLRQSGREDEWEAWLQFAQTWQALQAKDVCQHYDIKKPTPAKIREALLSLQAENVAEWSDKDVVVQRLVELYPELELRQADTAEQPAHTA